MTGDEVAELLGLVPLEAEGGRWAQTWLDDHGSAIYFLLVPGDPSTLHRLDGPELWHHYAGAAVDLLLFGSDGTLHRRVLGDDLEAQQRPFAGVEAGVWMAAATTGEWSLVGTTMAPPFRAEAFEPASGAVIRSLQERHPDLAGEIARYIPPGVTP